MKIVNTIKLTLEVLGFLLLGLCLLCLWERFASQHLVFLSHDRCADYLSIGSKNLDQLMASISPRIITTWTNFSFTWLNYDLETGAPDMQKSTCRDFVGYPTLQSSWTGLSRSSSLLFLSSRVTSFHHQ